MSFVSIEGLRTGRKSASRQRLPPWFKVRLQQGQEPIAPREDLGYAPRRNLEDTARAVDDF